ncbi:hypothetical protein [Streptomyces formicae]|uniref:Uncharacterized protein n=1 Tax=Streptomyces formicae TaxID=1616117 RepID=A0A291QD55_9ACTN|nr:hypothetical protein [Streptomyces formicae]ATL29393.1 hypothetical protein KY5_4375c [Streptomyces formicae]
MFEIRVICEPDDVTKVKETLTLAFDLTSAIDDRPTRDGHRRRLYTKAKHRTVPPVQCAVCGQGVQWVDSYREGWWVHAHMDTPSHEAEPPTWQEGDRLMAALAAAMSAYCGTDVHGLVRADPKDIAVVAASIARLLPST